MGGVDNVSLILNKFLKNKNNKISINIISEDRKELALRVECFLQS
jgi:hypothetical protein